MRVIVGWAMAVTILVLYSPIIGTGFIARVVWFFLKMGWGLAEPLVTFKAKTS